MQTKVCEWENNQGVRLSEDVLHAAGFALNEVLNVQVSGGIIILTKKMLINHWKRERQSLMGIWGLMVSMNGESQLEERVGK